MSSSVPKVLILGHSFVKRLHCDLKAGFGARADSSFNLEGTASATLFGVGGRTAHKLRLHDLHVVRRLAPRCSHFGDRYERSFGFRTGGGGLVHRGACFFAFERFCGECYWSLSCHSTWRFFSHIGRNFFNALRFSTIMFVSY
ncbi:unnamed protein product [Porites lobata]|uniref:Uncharacterized protein n=1 Tax=Porites lobata TaxID=104759 RepID=A0ABN8R4K8_9CNID|nr:unnamed protein product [Porites lobata]